MEGVQQGPVLVGTFFSMHSVQDLNLLIHFQNLWQLLCVVVPKGQNGIIRQDLGPT